MDPAALCAVETYAQADSNSTVFTGVFGEILVFGDLYF